MANILSFLGPVGPMELTIIFLLVLLLFGAKKLPEFAKGLGKSLGEFKKAREDFESEITRAEQDAKEPPSAKPKADSEA